MGDLVRFLKQNKMKRKNVFFVATKDLTDEQGKPLKWEIRPLTTRDADNIRESCMYDAPVVGKRGHVIPKLETSKYLARLICASVVEPNLNSKELQDSYGVMSAEDLLREMVDLPGEYAKFSEYIQKLNGFDETLDELVEEAKN